MYISHHHLKREKIRIVKFCSGKIKKVRYPIFLEAGINKLSGVKECCLAPHSVLLIAK
jgi:hypothetical protein